MRDKEEYEQVSEAGKVVYYFVFFSFLLPV
jgi:hypothetical protein